MPGDFYPRTLGVVTEQLIELTEPRPHPPGMNSGRDGIGSRLNVSKLQPQGLKGVLSRL
jgi:hypothetical protein